MKKTTISAISIASLTFIFSACGGNAVNTTVNNSAANNAANKPNTAVVVNSNQTAVTNTTPASSNNATNANKTSSPKPATDKGDADKIQGELQMGKTESVILYFGAESGDYAAYCFTNDSEAGRAILDACKDKEQCEISGTFDYEVACKVPGLEADLSSSGRILKVDSAKSLGRKK